MPQLLEHLTLALALLWEPASRTRILQTMQALGFRASGARAYAGADVTAGLRELHAGGDLWMGTSRGEDYYRVREPEIYLQHGAVYRLQGSEASAAYARLLESATPEELESRLLAAWGIHLRRWGWPMYEYAPSVSLLRLRALGGATWEEFREAEKEMIRHGWGQALQAACLRDFDASLFQRIAPKTQGYLLSLVLTQAIGSLYPVHRRLVAWGLDRLRQDPTAFDIGVHHYAAMYFMLRGEANHAEALLKGLDTGLAAGIRAAGKALSFQWAEARDEFKEAFKRLRKELDKRKDFLPPGLSWLYPLSLLALHTPADLETARKFCQAESGTSRQPDFPEGWHLWTHAIAVRLGTSKLIPHAFNPPDEPGRGLPLLYALLLRAWLGEDGFTQSGDPLIESVTGRAAALEFNEVGPLLSGCASVMAGDEVPPGFFVSGTDERWRLVLSALTALSGAEAGKKGAARKRTLWSVHLDGGGGVLAIVPLEQSHGKRGWNKPREIPLSRLAKAAKLEAADAAVARAIRRDRRHAGQYHLDRAAAMLALIGHPRVILDGQADQFVDVARGAAGLDVRRSEESVVLRMVPEPHELDELPEWAPQRGTDEKREAAELRFIHVTEESPGSLRIIHHTEGQRKVADILAGGITIPSTASQEIDAALQALGTQFQIHSDEATQAARREDAETRLRAELTPAGGGLRMRLVSAPLGPDGPRLTPGRGRPSLMASVAGKTRSTNRDLASEQEHLDQVLDALGFLEPPLPSQTVMEWEVAEPDLALGMLEELTQLQAIADIDWPRGTPVRVVPIDSKAVTLRIRTERDWFGVEGEVAVDEERVLSWAAIVAAAAKGDTRFISMGDGTFAALSRELRERAAALFLVSESTGDTLRVPLTGASILELATQEMVIDGDEAFLARLRALETARTLDPQSPSSLQARLRPYQEEGFAWATRLAHAGFGAVLADDMGLGKTVQSLAVMLNRAGDGPALVVAPTSVCGNWEEEIRRFAPSLTAVSLAGADRQSAVQTAGPGTVIIVSYTLLSLEQELLQGITWSTIVADEAQAVKNAQSRRSKALLSLNARFRLALSGTPIENRLSELRSIMEFANPGLLGSPRQFAERFASPIERDGDRDRLRRLRRLVAPFILRRTKGEVLLELPPRTELMLHVEASDAEMAHYEALRRTALAEAQGGDGQKFHILALLTRLRRAACDPRLVTPEFPGRGAKVQAFGELARDLVKNGHRALVFSQFVDFLTLLKEPLGENGIAYQYLDGSTPAAERTRRVRAFQQGEGSLFLISLKAGGYGLNLTAADYVVITDPWWNPAAEDQAMGRAHRMGQERPVTAYRLVSRGTLEERILELHRDKRALADGILADGAGSLVLPDADEMIALIRGEGS